MSAIHSHLPPLAQSLLSLSAQTQPAPVSSDGDADQAVSSSVPSSTDTLTLSSASSTAAAAAQVEQQNQLAALADPAAALAATRSAVAFLGAQPAAALKAQANLDPSIALNLA